MKYLLPVLLLIVLPFAAQAKPTLRLELGACDAVVSHVPSPDVDYQPGYDAYSQSVVPADLGGPQVPLGPIEVPLTVGLANRLHLPDAASGTNAGGSGGTTGVGTSGPATYGNEAYVGTVVVDGGQVLLNGAPLTDELEANLAVLCMQANKPGN